LWLLLADLKDCEYQAILAIHHDKTAMDEFADTVYKQCSGIKLHLINFADLHFFNPIAVVVRIA
jgi:hypothetical protein